DRNSAKAMRDHLKNPNSIRTIKIYKLNPNLAFNLVRDTFEIADQQELERIRQMLTEVQRATWKRPLAAWNATMKLFLTNGTTFEVEVSKIYNDRWPGTTHVYFEAVGCASETGPNYSKTLGKHLEELTGFNGVTY
ncbi:MAG TPA: hypothetical protein VGD31_17615, partial [Sphingobacteriaceae bacterium]